MQSQDDLGRTWLEQEITKALATRLGLKSLNEVLLKLENAAYNLPDLAIPLNSVANGSMKIQSLSESIMETAKTLGTWDRFVEQLQTAVSEDKDPLELFSVLKNMDSVVQEEKISHIDDNYSTDKTPSDYSGLTAISIEDGLYLHVAGEGNATLFSQQFAHVWGCVPQEDKTKMIDWWHKNGAIYDPCPDIWLTQNRAPNPKLSLAWNTDMGCRIMFQTFVVDKMPIQILNTLIAYQLAAVRLTIEHYTLSHSSPPSFQWRDVAKIVAEWGFDAGMLFLWKKDNQSWISYQEDIINGPENYLEDADD